MYDILKIRNVGLANVNSAHNPLSLDKSNIFNYGIQRHDNCLKRNTLRLWFKCGSAIKIINAYISDLLQYC